MEITATELPVQFKKRHKYLLVFGIYFLSLLLACLFKLITGQPLNFSPESIEYYIGGTFAFFVAAFFVFKLYSRNS